MANFKQFNNTPLNGGIGYKNFYPNGFGVSIVNHQFSYGGKEGLWELAVLLGNADDYRLCYDTPITNDVMGYLTEEEVNDIVDKIEKLPEDAWIPSED